MGFTMISVMNMLYQHITHSELFSDVKKPNGKLCKIQRPANSDREDVVINGLGLDREEVQEGVFNVNVYVPNLKYPFGHPSFGDKSQPDTGRILYLNNLTNTALGTGEEIWNEAGTCCFNVQQDNVFEDSNNQHYINFRIEFYITN